MRGENARFGHLITAMATPLTPSGDLDLDRAVRLARYLLANGSDAVVVNGTTGESPTTTVEEKAALVETIVGAVGAGKVIAGAGGNSTAEVVHLAQASARAGATAFLSVAPYYNKPSQEGLHRHFRAVADAADGAPVILYNVPGRTITNIDASTTARLARDAANIVGTKEASANMAQVAEIIRITPDDFDVYSGDDATILPTLALGGAGVISVISHLAGPDLARMMQAWYRGDCAEAARLFLATLPVTRAIFSAPSPAPLKYALRLVGQETGGVRLPLVDLEDEEQAIVRAALREYGVALS